MGRRKKRRRGGKSITRTAFKLVRLGALAMPAVGTFMSLGTGREGMRHVGRKYTGYDYVDGSFKFDRLLQGWGPYIGACLATYGIPKIVSIIRRL